MSTTTYPALDGSKTYVFQPEGMDKEEKLWEGNSFFPAPGDEVKVRRHREGVNVALIARPDGTPCGTALHASLTEKA
jgi:hypothetical protein